MTSRSNVSTTLLHPGRARRISWVPLYLKTLVALTVALCANSPLYAQVSKGVINGRAADSGGGVLQGARIQLQPGGVATVSNNQGEFTFSDVAPGTYHFSVSFVGFALLGCQARYAFKGCTRTSTSARRGREIHRALLIGGC